MAKKQLESLVPIVPISLIVPGTPGLLPLVDFKNVSGMNLVLRAENLKARMRFAKNQILLNVGGNGCHVEKMGRGVFGKHLDGEEAKWDRSAFIGVASDELVERARLDPSTELPIDLALRDYMAIVPNEYAHGATIKEALKRVGKRALGKGVVVYKCHPEARVNDMGYLEYPKGTTAELVE